MRSVWRNYDRRKEMFFLGFEVRWSLIPGGSLCKMDELKESPPLVFQEAPAAMDHLFDGLI